MCKTTIKNRKETRKMKKRMGSLFLGAMMVLLLAVPAFAAGDAVDVSGSSWCSCGGKMTESVHYTGWVTQQFVDCTHGIAHSKDAYQTCLRVTTTVCPKCGNMEYEADQFQATGGNFAKLFDVQNKRFTTITCPRCGYTELYKEMSDGAMDVLDFLIGG